MRHEKKKNRLLFCMILISFMMISSPFIISHYYLPNQIYLIAGKSHEFDFALPMKASLTASQDLHVRYEDADLEASSSVILNKPLTLKMDEVGKADMTLSVLGIIPIKTVAVSAEVDKELIPCGQIIGVHVVSDGIPVVGTGSFEVDGVTYDPAKDLLKQGDIVTAINGECPLTKEDFKEMVQQNQDNPLLLTVLRGTKSFEVTIKPQYVEEEDTYKIGLWIKDSIQGIGTLTYIDPVDGSFGALGHGITDAQLKRLMPVRGGEILKTQVSKITKGERGNPGELGGSIHYSDENVIGEVKSNNNLGIYGIINERATDYVPGEKIPIAFQDEVKEGEGVILTQVEGGAVTAYKVMIQKSAKYSAEPSKGMIIKIIDDRLLAVTNGIVQGMSGSPIIQDGKLIGAVTHVFVQDPTKGYGIFIENMLNNDTKWE